MASASSHSSTSCSSSKDWAPESWRSCSVHQQPVEYPAASSGKLDAVLGKLRSLPPIVTQHEVERLRTQLADVANNRAFLLHGGDCAELFDYCNTRGIEQRVSLLLLSSLVLVHGGRSPVVRILRGAGQYAKPRSKATETVDGVEYTSFRGDNVNGIDLSERMPDPDRLLQAYFHSATTLNYIRGLLAAGFASLHNPRSWKLSHVRNPQVAASFETIIERLEDSLDFLKVIGGESTSLQGVDFFTSHEGLMLEYETALTRTADSTDSKTPKQTHYNASAHFIWIGDRTRAIDGAHIEYFRGIRNPIGLKAGPTLEPEELVRLLDILDPHFEDGKVTIIGRYGVGKVEECLPRHIKAVQGTKHRPVFCADIMHGNTVSAGIYKTRHLADMASELTKSFAIHLEHGSKLQGVHLEMTGDTDAEGFSVTECLGGSMELEVEELAQRYQSHCDPRLNTEQTLDIAFLVADYMTASRKGRQPGNNVLSSLASREPSESR